MAHSANLEWLLSYFSRGWLKRMLKYLQIRFCVVRYWSWEPYCTRATLWRTLRRGHRTNSDGLVSSWPWNSADHWLPSPASPYSRCIWALVSWHTNQIFFHTLPCIFPFPHLAATYKARYTGCTVRWAQNTPSSFPASRSCRQFWYLSDAAHLSLSLLFWWWFNICALLSLLK